MDKDTERENLIVAYIPYVKRIVNRIASRLPPEVEKKDLMNAGIIGLIESLDHYDPAGNASFKTFATFRIKGALLNQLRAADHLSRGDRKKVRELKKAAAGLAAYLGRPPEHDEIAKELDMDINEYFHIRKKAAFSIIHFEELAVAAKDRKKNVMEELADPDTGDPSVLIDRQELCKGLARAVAELAEKEKLVISLYYQDELTMKEIGKVLDISESRVSQIHTGAVLQLRLKLDKAGLL
ncbi:MAG: FliA/WhiG family RNA polymerase sigma factor [Desulfococcaceae bacterium]|jgi:RNA polymerase sigma factor for flagellar operon FliA|nr:FliA/WhiG family RNA polymerase sigma factor [Desulfococcaceae bacterium]